MGWMLVGLYNNFFERVKSWLLRRAFFLKARYFTVI